MRLSGLLWLFILAVGLFAPGRTSADTFDTIKAQLRKAECVRISFQSIVESSIFESSDTVGGQASIEHAGRYSVTLGLDRYIFNGADLFSYSHVNQQVTVERVASDEQFGAEVSFLTRLDEIYKTRILRPDSTYRLVKTARGYANVPDSMVVTIDKKARMIRLIEYLDINEEPTKIRFMSQTLDRTCDPGDFKTDFPDSVQVIRLK